MSIGSCKRHLDFIRGFISGAEMAMREIRIELATLSVLGALAGIVVAIHGLAYDQARVSQYGTAAIIVGVASRLGH
jgi:hypothetical protein